MLNELPKGGRETSSCLWKQLPFSRASHVSESHAVLRPVATSLPESLALTMAYLSLEFPSGQPVSKHTKATSGLFLFPWPSILAVQMHGAIFILFGLVEL